MVTTTELINISITPTRVYSYLSAGVQPRQDPGGTLRMNGIGKRERRHMRPAKSAREERERERERKRDQTGLQQSLAMLYFFTMAFIP